MNEESSEPRVDVTMADEAAELASFIQRGLGGRVREFKLEVLHGGIILRGRAATYFAKQLAQEAVMRATDWPILGNEIVVT